MEVTTNSDHRIVMMIDLEVDAQQVTYYRAGEILQVNRLPFADNCISILFEIEVRGYSACVRV